MPAADRPLLGRETIQGCRTKRRPGSAGSSDLDTIHGNLEVMRDRQRVSRIWETCSYEITVDNFQATEGGYIRYHIGEHIDPHPE